MGDAAYLGPAGTFTHQAALRLVPGAALRAATSIESVFDAVERASAQTGVVPIENSTEGGVRATLDRLAGTSLAIVAELVMPIEHCLLGRTADQASVTHVYSHPQALAQCRSWLAHHLPDAALEATTSTAAAARRVRDEPAAAAVAADVAAAEYGLEIVARCLQDDRGNHTRFLALAKRSRPRSADTSYKTSLVVGLGHRPGDLHAALGPLARRGINLTKIESRPAPGAAWAYIFFIDLVGHADDDDVAAALSELSELAQVKRLGSYPAATTPS